VPVVGEVFKSVVRNPKKRQKEVPVAVECFIGITTPQSNTRETTKSSWRYWFPMEGTSSAREVIIHSMKKTKKPRPLFQRPLKAADGKVMWCQSGLLSSTSVRVCAGCEKEQSGVVSINKNIDIIGR